MRMIPPRRFKVSLALCSLALLSAFIVGAAKAPLKETRIDQETVRIVAEILKKGHLSKPQLGDEVSRKWLANYIKAFDPRKMYFLKGDIEEFDKSQDKLDDWAKDGNLEFAKQVFATLLQRHDERLADINALLDQEPDFSVEESMPEDAKKMDWPATAEEAKDRWRKYIKYELLVSKVDGEERAETVRRLKVRFKDINRDLHLMDMSELLETYLTALTTAIDPHSSYLSAKNFEDMMNQTLHLSLEGIGARLRPEGGFTIVDEVVPGGAADRDGRLQAEDKILGVIQQDGKTVDFQEMKISNVVRYIRGPRGTKVKLIVQPAKSTEKVNYELTREKIELKDAHAQAQVLDAKDKDGNPLKIGVIMLPTFYGDTRAVLQGDADAVSATLDCRKFLKDFQKQGVQAVIMDLRGNPGGLLNEAETLSGLFINTGPVVQVRNAEGVVPKEDDEPGTAWDGPLAVIIDKTSASASEIFAGVIQDYGRGIVIGDSSTFGKGTVQQLFPINEQLRLPANAPDLGAIKLTIQQFYRANGASTQIEGVRPDIHIPSPLDQIDLGEGKIDNALAFDKVQALPHDEYGRVTPELVKQLDERSAKRREGNKEFQEQQTRIRKLIERKERDSISLNEKTFRDQYVAESEENKAEREAEKERKKKKVAEPNKAWKSDFYNNEIMSIISDYVSLGAPLFKAPVRAASR